jgi:hypothetical protein
MRRPTRREVVLAVVFALVVAVLLLWFRGCGPVGVSTDPTGHGSVRASSSFTISGEVRRLISPGELVPIDLRLDNAGAIDLAIDHVTVAMVGIDAPRANVDHSCNAADFEVRQLSAGVVLRIAGNSAENLSGMDLPEENWPAVSMVDRPVNQDGCKGASLTLRYEASGVEVPR